MEDQLRTRDSRDVLERLRKELPDASFTYTAQVLAGEVALLEWTAVAATGARVEDGAGSFIIRDGFIRAQTIHYTVLPPSSAGAGRDSAGTAEAEP